MNQVANPRRGQDDFPGSSRSPAERKMQRLSANHYCHNSKSLAGILFLLDRKENDASIKSQRRCKSSMWSPASDLNIGNKLRYKMVCELFNPLGCSGRLGLRHTHDRNKTMHTRSKEGRGIRKFSSILILYN